MPSDVTLEERLRSAVRDVFRTGQLQELTVKRVRATVEKELKLRDDYFKTHSSWKARSKEIVDDEANEQFALQEKSERKPDEDGPANDNESSNGGPGASPLDIPAPAARGKKRRSPQPSPSNPKRRKGDAQPKKSRAIRAISSSAEEDSAGEAAQGHAEADDSTDAAIEMDQVPNAAESGSELSELADEGPPAKKVQQKQAPISVAEVTKFKDKKEAEMSTSVVAADSDSELSVLIDEEPAPKKQRRKKAEPPASKKKNKAKPSKSRDTGLADGPEEEIKRLQSWLLKCGVRKLWHKELARYDSPRDKIKHLKGMLAEIGMEGRFSVEKARRIKERRELQAEVAAVQESTKRMMRDDDGGGDEDEDGDEAKDEGPPRRRLVKRSAGLDFLGSDDGEETD